MMEQSLFIFPYKIPISLFTFNIRKTAASISFSEI